MATLTIIVPASSIYHQETIRTGSRWGAREVSRVAASLAMTPGAMVRVSGTARHNGMRRIVENRGRFYTRVAGNLYTDKM